MPAGFFMICLRTYRQLCGMETALEHQRAQPRPPLGTQKQPLFFHFSDFTTTFLPPLVDATKITASSYICTTAPPHPNTDSFPFRHWAQRHMPTILSPTPPVVSTSLPVSTTPNPTTMAPPSSTPPPTADDAKSAEKPLHTDPIPPSTPVVRTSLSVSTTSNPTTMAPPSSAPPPTAVDAKSVEAPQPQLLYSLPEEEKPPKPSLFRTIEFLAATIARLFARIIFRQPPGNEIIQQDNCPPLGDANHNIFVGALPNSLTNDAKILKDLKIKSVLSITEDFETNNYLLSRPYSAEMWNQNGISYGRIEATDHRPLNNAQMHIAAQFIHEQLRQGHRIYIHCKAGVGRSNQAIAAYLIEYCKHTPKQAQATIGGSRPGSTIYETNKTAALEEFYKECEPQHSKCLATRIQSNLATQERTLETISQELVCEALLADKNTNLKDIAITLLGVTEDKYIAEIAIGALKTHITVDRKSHAINFYSRKIDSSQPISAWDEIAWQTITNPRAFKKKLRRAARGDIQDQLTQDSNRNDRTFIKDGQLLATLQPRSSEKESTDPEVLSPAISRRIQEMLPAAEFSSAAYLLRILLTQTGLEPATTIVIKDLMDFTHGQSAFGIGINPGDVNYTANRTGTEITVSSILPLRETLLSTEQEFLLGTLYITHTMDIQNPNAPKLRTQVKFIKDKTVSFALENNIIHPMPESLREASSKARAPKYMPSRSLKSLFRSLNITAIR